jgi:hypothetical protein
LATSGERAALRTNGTTTNRQRGPAALCRLPGARGRRARVNRRSDRSHWLRPSWARSKDARARARLSHSGRCGGSHHSIVGFPQTTAIADLPDRCAPTGFGLSQGLCRFGLGLCDFWISARLDALLDDAEFGRGQAAEKARRGDYGHGNLGCVGVDEGHPISRPSSRLLDQPATAAIVSMGEEASSAGGGRSGGPQASHVSSLSHKPLMAQRPMPRFSPAKVAQFDFELRAFAVVTANAP